MGKSKGRVILFTIGIVIIASVFLVNIKHEEKTFITEEGEIHKIEDESNKKNKSFFDRLETYKKDLEKEKEQEKDSELKALDIKENYENAIYNINRSEGFQELWFEKIASGEFEFIPIRPKEDSIMKLTLDSGKMNIIVVKESGGVNYYPLQGRESYSVDLSSFGVCSLKVSFKEAKFGGISIDNINIPGEDYEDDQKEEETTSIEKDKNGEDIIDISFIDYKEKSLGSRGDSKSRYSLGEIEKGMKYTQGIAYTSTGAFRTNNLSQIDYKIESGKMMLVFFNKEGMIVEKFGFEGKDSGTISIANLGEVDMKIVGDNLKNGEALIKYIDVKLSYYEMFK